MALLGPRGWAQEEPIRPEAGSNPYTAGTADSSADAVKKAAADDLSSLLEGLTPEQLAVLVKEASKRRLTVERQQVIDEIRTSLLYDPDDVDKAVRILEDNPPNTQQDNINRICRALAQVDSRFAKPYKLLEEGKYDQAAAAAKAVVNAQQATYLSAAKYYVYGTALVKQGKGEDAADVYREIWTNMPDRVSFACAAASQSAQAYEAAGRGLYAMQTYLYCLKNYALTLEQEEFDRMLKRAQELADEYKDPMKAVATKMGDVQGRLSRIDSGKETQQKQKEIVALLEDLIKTAEEASKSSSSSSPQRGQRRGQENSQDQATGQTQGPAAGKNRPVSPARISSLPPGAVERPKLSSVHTTDEKGDWAELPPREREKIEQIRNKVLSERYRDIISDYRTRLAEENQK